MSLSNAELENALARLGTEDIAALRARAASSEVRDQMWERCSQDIWYWLDHFVTTANLHREETVLGGQPMITLDKFPRLPHTEAIIDAYMLPSNLIIEKSRDMMLSWTMVVIFLHDLIFQSDSVPMFMTTYRDELVDDGGVHSTDASLMGRVRGVYERLPDWMKARAPMRFKKHRITNIKTGSFISGHRSNEHSSRGGKFYRTFADEYGHFERSEATLSALTPACPTGLCLGSTPGISGRNNAFGRIANSEPDKETGLHHGFKKITLHWRMHPDRNDEWYEAETIKLTKEAIAREYEIGYDSAITARVYSEFSRKRHVGQYAYDPDLPLYMSADHGLANEIVLFWQIHGEGDDKQFWVVKEFAAGILGGFGVKMSPWKIISELRKVMQEPPMNIKFHNKSLVAGQITDFYADPRGQDDTVAVQNRKSDDSRLTSFWAVYRDHGFYPQGKYSKIADGTNIVQRWVEKDQLRVDKSCLITIESMLNYQYRVNSEGEVQDTIKPSPNNHACDALRYFSIYKDSMRGINTKPQEYVERWITSSTGARYPIYLAVEDDEV